jgi:cell division topological specificity factor
MFDFFKSLFKPAPPSGETAKERLRLVLLSDHLSLAPDVIESLKRDLMEVISRYVEIDSANADVTFEHREREIAMLASIPITGVRERKAPQAFELVATAVAEPIAAPEPVAEAQRVAEPEPEPESVAEPEAVAPEPVAEAEAVPAPSAERAPQDELELAIAPAPPVPKPKSTGTTNGASMTASNAPIPRRRRRKKYAAAAAAGAAKRAAQQQAGNQASAQA